MTNLKTQAETRLNAEPLGGAGRAACFPDEGPGASARVRWFAKTARAAGGKHTGGLTAAADLLFAAGDDFMGKKPATRPWPKQAVLTVLGVDTGEVRWAFAADTESMAGAPVVVREGLALLSTTLGVHAFEARSGRQVWFSKLPCRLVTRPLAVVDDFVVTPLGEGGLACVDLKTGTRRAVVGARYSGFGGPFASHEGVLFFTAEEPEVRGKRRHVVAALDLRGTTPRLRWKAPTFHDGDDGPIVSHGRVFYWENPGQSAELRLVALDASSGNRLWARESAALGLRSLAANAHTLVTARDEGPVLALDAADGRNRWTSSWGGQPGRSIGRCCLTEHSVYAVRDERDVKVLVSLHAATGTLEWKLSAPEPDFGWVKWAPTVHAGRVFAQTQGGVCALGA